MPANLAPEEYKKRLDALNEKLRAAEKEVERLERSREHFTKSRTIAENLFKKRTELINIIDNRRKLRYNQGIKGKLKKDSITIRDLFFEQNAMIQNKSVELSKIEDPAFQRVMKAAMTLPFMVGEVPRMERKKKKLEQDKLKQKKELQEVIKELKHAASPEETERREQKYRELCRKGKQKKRHGRGKR